MCMLAKFVKTKRVKMAFAIAGIFFAGVVYLAPSALALSGEVQVVNEFAEFLITILTGPVSKILAAVILITGVVNLFQGKTNIAVGCAFAFLVLMFLPKLLESFKG